MRVVHRASLVFLLKDIYSKLPITSAVILCDGKQNPYTRKNDGYYVFSNLYPREYKISISCAGYVPLEFKVNLRENETQVIPITMPYSVDNVAMSKMTHFNINVKHYNKAVANTGITFKLVNSLKFMKLVEPVAPQTDVLKLNIEDMTAGLLGQTYLYSTQDRDFEFTIDGFDGEKKAYILREYSEEEIPTGGEFYAVWNLKTDSSGRITMPYMSQYMTENPIIFEILTDVARVKVEFDVSGKEQSAETLYAKVSLRKIPKNQLEKAKKRREPAPKANPENEEESAVTDGEENVMPESEDAVEQGASPKAEMENAAEKENLDEFKDTAENE